MDPDSSPAPSWFVWPSSTGSSFVCPRLRGSCRRTLCDMTCAPAETWADAPRVLADLWYRGSEFQSVLSHRKLEFEITVALLFLFSN